MYDDFWPWLILAHFLLITLISSASSLLFARAFLLLRRLSRDKHFRLAPSFVAFVLEMALLSTILALGGAVMVLNWRKGGYNSADLVFWTGVSGGCLLPAVPIGILFLSLDRLLILHSPFARSNVIKSVLGALSAFSVALLTILHFVLNLQHHLDIDADEVRNSERGEAAAACWTFACLSGEFSISAYTIDRIAVAVPNFCASIALWVLLLKRRRKSPREGQLSPAADESRWRMGCKVALWTAILQFLFDLVPSVANLVATYGFDTNLSTVIGPYRQLTGAMNTLGCAMVYRQFFERQWNAQRQVVPSPSAAVEHVSSKGSKVILADTKIFRQHNLPNPNEQENQEEEQMANSENPKSHNNIGINGRFL